MNSVVGSSVPADVATPRATTREVSLFRLYTLRVAYLIMAAGLGAFIWPNVIHHTNEFAAAHGYPGRLARGPRLDRRIGPSIPAENVTGLTVRTDLEGDLFDSLCAAVVVRPPDHDATAEDIKAVLMVVILIPLIPWPYVFAHHVLKHGDRWK